MAGISIIQIKESKQFHVLTVLLLLIFLYSPVAKSAELYSSPPIFIAHAGGAINNKTYTNSLEALNLNYEKGHRFFEVDFSWTSDGELVAIHDWEAAFKQNFKVSDGSAIPTKAQFLQLETKTGLTQLSLENVLKWADDKKDVYIVTDVKDANIKALLLISTQFSTYKKYIIPQVYNYSEYFEAARLGYDKIILTLYRIKINPMEVLNFSITNSPFAITMPWKVAQSGLAYYLSQNKTRVYAHTVNDLNLFTSLRQNGVYGIYTDHLSPQ